jgi:hypothetical protein
MKQAGREYVNRPLLNETMPMAVLDCESYESSIKSICDLYATNPADVTEFLSTINLEDE